MGNTHLRLYGGITFVLALLLCSPLGADDETALPEFDATGFTRIFDGETLDGWEGDPEYWSVDDGVLVGRVTADNLLSENSWIVWRGGQVDDFELVLDYRVSQEGNSGVGYRLSVLEGKPFSVRGPQADIEGGAMFTGISYEENGRRLLAGRGQSTWIGPDSRPRLIVQFADPAQVESVARDGDWNRYHVVARGSYAGHYINDVLVCEVFDHDEANRMHAGLIGVQVHVGPPMTIEFRDIYLRHLDATSEGPLDTQSVTYRPGTLVELEHQPTFENLVSQTAAMTAPASSEPLNGQMELEFVTSEVAIVRSDLKDVSLFGGAFEPSNVETLDLAIAMDGECIRIRDSEAVRQIVRDQSWGKEYAVHLQWNPQQEAYELLSLEAVEE